MTNKFRNRNLKEPEAHNINECFVVDGCEAGGDKMPFE